MNGALTDQGINYNKGIFYSPTIEYVDLQLTSSPVKYIWIDQDESKDQTKRDLTSQQMDTTKSPYDEVVKKFFVEKFTKKIQYLQSHPDQFLIDENIQQPNDLSFNYTFQTINKLADLNIFPDRLIPSVEEGICLNFKNKGRVLYFEIYNSGDLGYIIEDINLKQTIENEDVPSIDDMVIKIKDFIAV
jgi:hypothetical protein